MSCLDELALEKVLLDAPPAGASEHLAGCEACTARLTQMKAEGADFKQYVFPRTVDAVVEGARPRRWWPFVLVPLAVAAAASLVVFTRAPTPEYVGVKGQTVGLAVYSLDPQGAPVRLSDGARVALDANLRFQVRPDAPCHLWVLSVDQHGVVSRLFPAEGDAQRVSGETTLPGGAQLDGQAGPERLFAVCTEAPLSWAELQRAATLPSSADAVRATSNLSLDGRQSSVLLEKSP
jgi:hypothetical protein